MTKPTTKEDLVISAETSYNKLMVLISKMTDEEMTVPFDFSDFPSKKEAHWQRDKNVRDILAHLYEWHQLIIKWVKSNQMGNKTAFFPKPYNWRTYGEYNLEIFKKHQNTSLSEIKSMLDQSHKQIIALAEGFTDDELFSKGFYTWVGGSTLGSYFVSGTSSHYKWAMKKINAHKRNIKQKDV